ncbi:MAG: alkaline phosphatase PhoX [Pseudomonadota bacterium]
MQKKQLSVLVAGAVMALAANAQAASTYFDSFTPMIGDTVPGSLPETAPYKLSSPHFSQVNLANRINQNTLAPDSNSGNWDMITANETGADAGRYLFMPFETSTGGVQRVDLWDANYNTRTVTIVAPGTQGFVAGDASLWTPWGGYLTAEESWGTNSSKGRLFEVTNPTTAGAKGGNFVQRNIIPRVSHEGLSFDKHNNFYFVDELNGGAIYKYVSAKPNASNGDEFFNKGQTFVLKVGAGGQFEGNNGPAITGASSWVAVTDANGVPTIDTFSSMRNLGGGSFALDGRTAADLPSILGTGYNRPEDLQLQTLADGTEFLYFTTTDSDNDGNKANGRGRVYSMKLDTLEVKLAADNTFIDMATGAAVGTTWSNPDNLAIDAEGNIYAVEDQDGGIEDIWFLKDTDKDGVADAVGKWASLTTTGAESTGLYFDKNDPNVAYVNVQHPDSGDDMLIRITANAEIAPVPEPETYAMMLSGLGLVGLMARRRKA